MPNCRWYNNTCPVAIDPAVFTDDKGGLYMVYGSGTSGIWVVELDAETGHLRELGWVDDRPVAAETDFFETRL